MSMAARISAHFLTGPYEFQRNSILTPISLGAHQKNRRICSSPRKDSSLTICSVMVKKREDDWKEIDRTFTDDTTKNQTFLSQRSARRLDRKGWERCTYLVTAIMSSLSITSMATISVYCRFSWLLEGGEIPVVEMIATFALSVGSAVGMEFWARWAHRALWHASLWHMHQSHHRVREDLFELNDVFAVINAVPAILLLSYGFFHTGLLPALCFSAGLGITVFGMAYMFVHDGLVHRRFPVGPIALVPYCRKVAAAHRLHHSDKFDGVPYGLFLGPMEVEKVGGALELDKEIKKMIKLSETNK